MKRLSASDQCIFFFFFFFFRPAPPGFSLRWASCMFCVVAFDLIDAVSVAEVEPAALADSDKARRPAAPRSAVRMNDFILKPRWLVLQRKKSYSPENELKMND